MEFKPLGDAQTDTMMWIEVDLAGIMRAIPCGLLKGRIQRVSDIEMVAIRPPSRPMRGHERSPRWGGVVLSRRYRVRGGHREPA